MEEPKIEQHADVGLIFPLGSWSPAIWLEPSLAEAEPPSEISHNNRGRGWMCTGSSSTLPAWKRRLLCTANQRTAQRLAKGSLKLWRRKRGTWENRQKSL